MSNRTEHMRNILDTVNELFIFDRVGPIYAKEITWAFRKLLDKFGYADVSVDVLIDEHKGILIRFEDNEQDSVVVLFSIYDEIPTAIIVSDDDDQVEINLSSLAPPIIPVAKYHFIDLENLTWMNKSTLLTLLKAGRVGKNETCFVAMGNKRMRLPIVTKRKKNDQDNKILKLVKSLKWFLGSGIKKHYR